MNKEEMKAMKALPACRLGEEGQKYLLVVVQPLQALSGCICYLPERSQAADLSSSSCRKSGNNVDIKDFKVYWL